MTSSAHRLLTHAASIRPHLCLDKNRQNGAAVNVLPAQLQAEA